MAAKCFASINEFQHAADCLALKAKSKTSLNEDDLHALYAAALLCKAAQLDHWQEYIRHALVDVATCSGNWHDGHAAARCFKEDLTFVRYFTL